MKNTETVVTTTIRRADRIIDAIPAMEGEGVAIRRAFPAYELSAVDPFLLLDEMGPARLAAGQAKGFPAHPHRGFETVTYMLEGGVEHRDSFGNHGLIGPGDIQWMTAGSGLVHSEMPSEDLVKNGGTLHGFQLWVNLPKRDKMAAPGYQERPAPEIPAAESDGVRVRVIAGESLGAKAVIETRTPILYLHFTLQPGASVTQPVPAAFNAFAYVFGGKIETGDGGREVSTGQFAVYEHRGDTVRLANPGDAPAEVLLIAGLPLNEPIARGGPFVMNTKAELYDAFIDFQSGKMGRL